MSLPMWPNSRRGDVEGGSEEASLSDRSDVSKNSLCLSLREGGDVPFPESNHRDDTGVQKITRKAQVRKDRISRRDLCRRISELIDIPSGYSRRTSGYFTKGQLLRLHFWIQDSIAIRKEHKEMIGKLFHETNSGENP